MSSTTVARSASDLNRIFSMHSRVLTPADARFLHSIPSSSPEPFWLAHRAAENQMAPTAMQAARLLGENPPAVQRLLREAQRQGLFRRHSNPLNTSGEILYQPTAKALGNQSDKVPNALRSSASAVNLCYALQRAEIISMNPDERWLSYSAGAEWVMERGAMLRSYMPIVVCLAPRRRIIYEIVLPNEVPEAAIRRARRRWSDLTAVREGEEPIFVQLAVASSAAQRLQAALDRVKPANATNAIRRQLQAVDASILVEGNHPTLAGERLRLQVALATIEKQGDPLPYLMPDVLALAV